MVKAFAHVSNGSPQYYYYNYNYYYYYYYFYYYYYYSYYYYSRVTCRACPVTTELIMR